jgi:NTE family protein
MLGFGLENTTSDQFRVSLAARYLRFDVLASGSELRLDAQVGADPGIGVALYQPIWQSTFVVPYAGVSDRTYNLIKEHAVVARYSQTLTSTGIDVGINLGRDGDLRARASIGRLDANVEVGDPGLPSAAGKETLAHLTWRLNNQDSAVIASHGTNANAAFTYVFDGPTISVDDTTARSARTSIGLPQLQSECNWFWSPGDRNRVFVLGGGGTSFDHHPLAIDQFLLGRPLHLGAYDVGEVRGDHYLLGTVGYLRELGRMPDFLGGPIFAGAWLENGDAFNVWKDATWRTHASGGIIMDTLVGPMILAGSAGFDGRWRAYIGIGPLFR